MRSNTTILAFAILVLALGVQLGFGFRLGEASGQAADVVFACGLVAASVVLFAPLGRRRKWLATAAAFGAVILLTMADAHLSTALDVRYGGDYGWSGTRTLVLMLVSPVIATVAAILTFAFAHLPRFNIQPRSELIHSPPG